MLRVAADARLALVVLAVAAAAPRCPADQVVGILLNGGAEQCEGGMPVGWYPACRPGPGLRMWIEDGAAGSGRACFAIAEGDANEPPVSNNWAQKVRFIPGGKVIRLAGRIRTEDAEAANICVQCWGAGGRMLGLSSTPVYRGTHDWTYVQAPDMVVPPNTEELTVRAALTGKGRAFFDDLFLGIVGEPPIGEDGPGEGVPGRILRVVPVTKDCMVLAYLPRWSHGDVDNIAIANNQGGVRLLLEWDPPAPAEIARPNLRFLLALHARETFGSGAPAPVAAHEILAAWGEKMSWGEQPLLAERPAGTFRISAGTGWKILDMTALIRDQAKAARPGHGVLLRFVREDREPQAPDWCGFGFVSREGIGEHENRRPVLLVVDPDQPPDARPPAGRRIAKPPAAAGEALLEYVEYLAGIPGAKIEEVPEACPASAGARAGGREELEDFLGRYPLTPEGVQRMGDLAAEYRRAGRPAEAGRLAEAAMRLAKGPETSGLSDIGRARLEAFLGRPEAAEARLRSALAGPEPDGPRDRRHEEILLGAREALAEVLVKEGRRREADDVLRDLADRAVRPAQLPGGERSPARSWALAAYKLRIRSILDLDRDVDAARRLVEEFKGKVPDSRSPDSAGGSGPPSAAAEELDAWLRRRLAPAVPPERPPAGASEGRPGP